VDYTETATENSVSMFECRHQRRQRFRRAVPALRAAVKADVGDGAGPLGPMTATAGAAGSSTPWTTAVTLLADAARFGISVVSTDGANCAYARSAPHEIGHNLGAAQ